LVDRVLELVALGLLAVAGRIRLLMRRLQAPLAGSSDCD
jgi:hypothetical protein